MRLGSADGTAQPVLARPCTHPEFARLGLWGSARLTARRSLRWLGPLLTCSSARPVRLGSADGMVQPVLARLSAYLQLGSACEARLGWRHGAACAGSALYSPGVRSARPLRLGSAGGMAQPVLARPFAYLRLGSASEARLGWWHGAACAGSAFCVLAARLDC